MQALDYTGIFRREEKFIITRRQLKELEKALAPICHKPPYGDCRVYSLYYDTPQQIILHRSLEKGAFREKLRIRSYSVPSDNDGAYAELKRKCGGLVYKTRLLLPYTKAAELMAGNAVERGSRQEKEILYARSLYPGLAPAAAVSYQRSTFILKSAVGDVRITADSDVRGRTSGLDLRLGGDGDLLLDDDIIILEVKGLGAIPLPLAKELDGLGCRPSSFSKFNAVFGVKSTLSYSETEGSLRDYV